MEKELNFKTYENSWGLILCPIVEKYISIFLVIVMLYVAGMWQIHL